MTYPNVTLTGTLIAGPAKLTLELTEPYSDSANGTLFNPDPIVSYTDNGLAFSADVPDPTSDGSGVFWRAVVTQNGVQVPVYQETVQIGTTNGDSQSLFALTPAVTPTDDTYLPQPSGTATDRSIVMATGSGEESAWTTFPLITVSATPPSEPVTGDVWIETS